MGFSFRPRKAPHAEENTIAFDLERVDAVRLREFRDALTAHGYHSGAIWSRTRELPLAFRPGSFQEAAYEYLFADRPALVTLLKLWLSLRVFDRRDLLGVLPERVLEFLLDIGLLVESEGGYRAAYLLFPIGGRLLLTDRLGGIQSPADRANVFEFNKEQNILANALMPGTCDTALDLCTGSGVFAILMAAHAKRVWGVDVNPRAVNVARVNALLNAVTNVEFVEGDLYDAVAGATFDRIVANPPYNPGCGIETASKLSVHGGFGGEEVLFKILGGLERHLRQGGTAQIISRWFYESRGSYATRLASILDLDHFNVFLLQTRPRDIFTVSNLVKTSWSVGPGGLAGLADYYHSHGVDRESFGVLNARRVAGSGRFRDEVVDFDFSLDREFGDTIDQALAMQ